MDRPVIEALLCQSTPSEQDIVDASRLYVRYCSSRLSPDLAEAILQALRNWNLSVEEVQERARSIWQSGWRPTPQAAEEQPVGSGADVEG
jgi:hypothetical protein